MRQKSEKNRSETNKIDNMLRNYKTNRARLEIGRAEIEGLEQQLRLGKQYFKEEERECIEGIVLKTSVLSDMPKAMDNQFHSSTERAALNYNKDMYYKTEDAQRILHRIQQIEERNLSVSQEVRQVEILLDSLSEKYRYIIEQYYFEHWSWSELAAQYSHNYEEYRDKSTLIRWRDSALETMNEVCKAHLEL